MRISGAIFDVDGTLLDSMFVWHTIAEEYLRTLGIDLKETLYEVLKDMSLFQAATYLKTRFGIAVPVQSMMDDINGMIAHYYLDIVPAKKGVIEFLRALQARDVKMCVATATDHHLAEAALRRCGILDYFGKIFTCTAVGHGKDEPVIFEKAWEYLETPKPETVVFEDAAYAARSAKKAGFPLVALYDELETKQTELQALAEYYFMDFAQALAVLL